MDIILLESNYLIILCLSLICFDFPLYTLLFAPAKPAMLSQYIQIVVTGLGYTGMASKKFLSHYASLGALSRDISSDSIVDLSIQICLVDFHETTTYPFVVFVYVLSKI